MYISVMNVRINILIVCALVICNASQANGILSKIGSVITSIVNSIIPFGLDGYYDSREQTLRHEPILPQYDFIVVGGGSAGCVLANRLSENPEWKVLLLEAGGKEGIIHQVPLAAANLQLTSSNWGYQAEPQANACKGMRNNRCQMPRGRVLGGSSSINYMIYNRGNRRDFDRWAAAGNPGWSYDDVLPYFIKSENSNLISGLEDVGYHGHDGLLTTNYLQHRTKMVRSFVQALKESGLDEVDYNGERQVGVSYVQTTTSKAQRQSAYRSFIYPFRNRTNLHVRIFSRVTKILIDNATKTAMGVNFVSDNKKYSVKANKEVILSAGAFHSPQLLMLSGIGPADHLRQLNISLVQNLPVGDRMYDHVSHLGLTFTTNTTKQTPYVTDIGLGDIYDFLNGRGVLGLIGGVEALALVKVPGSPEPADFPDVELIFLAGGFASDEGTALRTAVNLREKVYDKLYRQFADNHQDHFTIVVMLLHPKSYGSVRLTSRNPFAAPVLSANFFHHPDDIATMLRGSKLVLNLMNTKAMQQIGVKLNPAVLPGCEAHRFASDDYLMCSIRTLSDTLHHQVTTCKMGPRNDPTAVVDHRLKVHGMKKLRVVDISVIPYAPTSHTNAAAFMIGEKAADMIKAEWTG